MIQATSCYVPGSTQCIEPSAVDLCNILLDCIALPQPVLLLPDAEPVPCPLSPVRQMPSLSPVPYPLSAGRPSLVPCPLSAGRPSLSPVRWTPQRDRCSLSARRPVCPRSTCSYCTAYTVTRNGRMHNALRMLSSQATKIPVNGASWVGDSASQRVAGDPQQPDGSSVCSTRDLAREVPLCLIY